IDSIKHISFNVNRHRAILPGYEYVSPPEQEKLNPLQSTEEDVLKRIDFNQGKLDKQLVQQFMGLSPLLAKEIIYKAHIANRVTLPKAFKHVMDKINSHQFEPTLMRSENKENFYLFPLDSVEGDRVTFP